MRPAENVRHRHGAIDATLPVIRRYERPEIRRRAWTAREGPSKGYSARAVNTRNHGGAAAVYILLGFSKGFAETGTLDGEAHCVVAILTETVTRRRIPSL